MHHSSLTLETIRFLRTLTDDGQLTGEEVWRLATWLNQHQSVWQAWPASVLIEPLASAFADHELSLQEMQALAGLIAGIEKTWADQFRKPSGDSAEAPEVTEQQVLEGADHGPRLLSLPVLPRFDEQVSVSCETAQAEYPVGLSEHTCDCADWSVRRSGFPPGSIARCCKHVAEALAPRVDTTACEPWLAAIILDCSTAGRGVPTEFEWHLAPVRDLKVALSKGDGAWANVFAPSETGPQRFAFNTSEWRWAYGVTPLHDREIIQTLKSRFKLATR